MGVVVVDVTAVIIPEALPIVASNVLLLLQVPPAGVALSVIVHIGVPVVFK